jgi:hypothetical protein
VPSPKAEEKRGAPRYPLERLAKIQPGRSNPPRYCLITNKSFGIMGIKCLPGRKRPIDFFGLLSPVSNLRLAMALFRLHGFAEQSGRTAGRIPLEGPARGTDFDWSTKKAVA